MTLVHRCALGTSLVLSLLGGVAASSIGQQQTPPSFRGAVDVVPLYVSVTDAKGQPVTGLAASDFEVRESGRQVPVAGFKAGPHDVAIQLLIDDRRRMVRHQRQARVAGDTLIDTIGTADQYAIGTYALTYAQFSADPGVLRTDLGKALRAEPTPDFDGWSAWRGVYQVRDNFLLRSTRAWQTRRAIWNMPSEDRWAPAPGPEVGPRAVVILSAGMDYRNPDLYVNHLAAIDLGLTTHKEWADRIKTEDEAHDRQARNVIRDRYLSFGVGFEGTRDDRRLVKMSADSGGWFLEVRRNMDWPGEMGRIVNDLRHRYLVGFVPVSIDDQDHDVTVTVNRPGVVVRAPAFYRVPRAK